MRPPRPTSLAPAFGHYLQYSVADGVHSGAGRTRAPDEGTDFYSVPLNEDELRPGTVYADPYGHLLMLAQARAADRMRDAGVFLAVDAQPDGTVARKRFWRGNFLFAQERALGDAGFKRFRPIVREKSGGLRRLTNAEIAKNPQYADFSLEQTKLSVEAFYDRMDDVMSPAPLDPVRAMKEAITSLDEQVRARVTSVENGRKYPAQRQGRGQMPDGAAIFETTGAWEDFATPSRDLRLLIAMDVVRGFPGSRGAAAGALRDAEGQEPRAGEGRVADRAGAGACAAQILLSAHRRLAMDAVVEGRGRPRRRTGNGLQRQRLRGVALGREGRQRRSRHLQAQAPQASARR